MDNRKRYQYSTFHLPWWVSLCSGIFSYILLKYLIPSLEPEQLFFVKICRAAPTFAPIVTIPFLLLSAKQLYDIDSQQRQKDSSDSGKAPQENEESNEN